MGKTYRGGGKPSHLARGGKINDWKLKREVEQAYRDRGRLRPTTQAEDGRVRKQWEREATAVYRKRDDDR